MTSKTLSLANLLPQYEKAAQQFSGLLTEPHFYLEIFLSIISIAIAILVSLLVRRYVARKTEGDTLSTHQKIVFSTLPLLGPLLAIIYLNIARPIALEFGSDSLINSIVDLCLAWLISRMVFIVIRTRALATFITVVIFVCALLGVFGLLAPTAEYLSDITIGFGKYRISVLGLLQGAIIFVVVFWMASSLSHYLEQYLRTNSRLSYNARELISKFFKITVYFIAFLITLNVLGIDLTAFAIFGGALGVGAGLGLQKITANFVSGVILLLEKSIKIGDLVEVGSYTGWVRQLNMRYALIETSEGREVLVPNDELMNTRITNWTYSTDSARIELRVVITYDSNAEKARDLMILAAKSHPKCQRNPAPACNLREFTETGLAFQLTFWIPNVRDGRAQPQSEVMFDIIQRFRENDIEFSHDPERKNRKS